MAKRIIGKVYRREGRQGERLFSKIECDQCGNIQFERRSGRVQKVVEAPCRECNRQRKLNK